MKKFISKYNVTADGISANVVIREEPCEFVYVYDLIVPAVKKSTRAYMDTIKNQLIEEITIHPSDILDQKEFNSM